MPPSDKPDPEKKALVERLTAKLRAELVRYAAEKMKEAFAPPSENPAADREKIRQETLRIAQSIAALKAELRNHGIGPEDLKAIVGEGEKGEQAAKWPEDAASPGEIRGSFEFKTGGDPASSQFFLARISRVKLFLIAAAWLALLAFLFFK